MEVGETFLSSWKRECYLLVKAGLVSDIIATAASVYCLHHPFSPVPKYLGY